MLALTSGAMLALESGIVLHSLPDQDSYYAFSVGTGDQFRLNRISFWVLEAIGDGTEWVILRDSFLATFEVPSGEGEADLRKLVNKMHRQGVIRRQGHGKEASV